MAERTAELSSSGLLPGADFHIGQNPAYGYLAPEQPIGWGDLETHNHLTRLEVVNKGLAPVAASLENVLRGPKLDVYPLNIQDAIQTADQLKSRIAEFHDENAFPSQESEFMARNMNIADTETRGESLEVATAARIAKFDKLHIASDNDGTLTELTGKINIPGIENFTHEGEYQPVLIPASQHAEPLLSTYGREHFPLIHSMLWRNYLKDPTGYDLFRNAGQLIPIRGGLTELLDFADQKDANFTIISANFKAVVEGVVDQAHPRKQPEIIAITPDSITPDKSKVLHSIAKQDPDQAIVYLGDWETDYSVVEAYNAGVVAAIFALEGASFDEKLNDAEIPHFTFRDLHDVRVKLEEVTELANQLKASNAIASF